jgi:hypothetical protein
MVRLTVLLTRYGHFDVRSFTSLSANRVVCFPLSIGAAPTTLSCKAIASRSRTFTLLCWTKIIKTYKKQSLMPQKEFVYGPFSPSGTASGAVATVGSMLPTWFVDMVSGCAQWLFRRGPRTPPQKLNCTFLLRLPTCEDCTLISSTFQPIGSGKKDIPRRCSRHWDSKPCL